MVDVAICGNKGSGKTLLLTAVCCWEKEHGKKHLFSTYHITYPVQMKTALEKEGVENASDLEGNYDVGCVDFSKLLALMSMGNTQFEPNSATLALDELHIGLDSRQSGSTANIFLSRQLFQSRKLGFDVYYTAQLLSSIDLREKRLCDYIVLCDCEPATSKENPGMTVPQFHYYILDLNNQGIGEFVIEHLAAQEIWKYYDSYEKVPDPEMQFGKEETREMIAQFIADSGDSKEADLIRQHTKRKTKVSINDITNTEDSQKD